jgi:hypothetical protein
VKWCHFSSSYEMYLPFGFSLQWTKRPGAILEASCILARVIFDESQQIQQPKLFEGQFQFERSDRLASTKLHRIFDTTKQTLTNILTGYTYPEPYFRAKLSSHVEKLFSILRDPALPLLEVEDILSNMSERIPKEVYSCSIDRFGDR